MKQKNKRYANFRLVSKTARKICDGVYVKEDGSEVIISFDWGGVLNFKLLKEEKKIERRT